MRRRFIPPGELNQLENRLGKEQQAQNNPTSKQEPTIPKIYGANAHEEILSQDSNLAVNRKRTKSGSELRAPAFHEQRRAYSAS
jgi:hypothetical protein